jgi:hypothetical protein
MATRQTPKQERDLELQQLRQQIQATALQGKRCKAWLMNDEWMMTGKIRLIINQL